MKKWYDVSADDGKTFTRQLFTENEAAAERGNGHIVKLCASPVCMEMYINGEYVGGVRRYYQNREGRSWIFVMDGQEDVMEIKWDNIRFFHSNGKLEIYTGK